MKKHTVSNDLTVKYDIRNTVGNTLTVKYNILEKVEKFVKYNKKTLSIITGSLSLLTLVGTLIPFPHSTLFGFVLVLFNIVSLIPARKN